MEAANCLDCHVGRNRESHEILAHTDLASPTNAQNLPDTCRGAGVPSLRRARISSAAVHLDLSRSRGVEYFIACIFVLLIVFTFGPSLLLTALKMLEIALVGHDPKEHEHHEMAVRLLADQQHPRPPDSLQCAPAAAALVPGDHFHHCWS